ncbi:MAG: hypothetical protein ACAH59_05090 [Pseudobdellovibrionaceae bacterium]
MKILFIFIALLAGQATALACPEIRLDKAGSLSSYPVFDQANASAGTDMNICYAATAAQLLDTYRASRAQQEQLQNERTSPWWLAVNYSSSYKKDENSDVQFGEPDKALETIKIDGVCSQADLFGDQPTEEIIRFHQMVKEFYQSAGKNTEEKDAVLKLETLLQSLGFIKDSTLLADISVKALKEKTFVLFLRTLFQGKCQGKVKQDPAFQIERIDTERKGTPVEEKDKIIMETLQKSQPIEVSVCSQVLRTPDYDGSKGSKPRHFAKDCMRHSMLVIGSRTQKGECQYLVRDTYGSHSCTRTRNGQPWYHPSLECDGGQVWVPKEAVLKNIWGMTRISPENSIQ